MQDGNRPDATTDTADSSLTRKLHGIHVMAYALFDAQERLDRAAMRLQTNLCVGAGVGGMAALGLATEVAKLSDQERRTVIDWVAEDTAGRVPLAFTIAGNSVAEQVSLMRAAEAAGAEWVILQPPMAGSYPASEYMRFFGRVADAAHVPVAVQNAPAYMGRGLAPDELNTLILRHPNICLLKAEAPAAEIEPLLDALEGRIPVFNGRGGLELTDNLRAGCAGLIMAPDVADRASRIYQCFRAGDERTAEAGYRDILPAIAFAMQSLEGLACYGKRLFGARSGIAVHDRAPAYRPSALGLSQVDQFAVKLGGFR